jgi:hypothetical protein
MTETMEVDAMIESRSNQSATPSVAPATEGVGEPGEDRTPTDLRPHGAGPAGILLPGSRSRHDNAVTGTPIARAPDHLRPVEQTREEEPRLSPTPSVVD